MVGCPMSLRSSHASLRGETARRRYLQRGDCIGVAFHCIRNALLAQVPYLDVVVDTARVQFVSSFRKGHGCNWKFGFDKVNGLLLSRIP